MVARHLGHEDADCIASGDVELRPPVVDDLHGIHQRGEASPQVVPEHAQEVVPLGELHRPGRRLLGGRDPREGEGGHRRQHRGGARILLERIRAARGEVQRPDDQVAAAQRQADRAADGAPAPAPAPVAAAERRRSASTTVTEACCAAGTTTGASRTAVERTPGVARCG